MIREHVVGEGKPLLFPNVATSASQGIRQGFTSLAFAIFVSPLFVFLELKIREENMATKLVEQKEIERN